MTHPIAAPLVDVIESTKQMDREDWLMKLQTGSVIFSVLMLGWGLASLIGVNMVSRLTYSPGPEIPDSIAGETVNQVAQLQDAFWMLTWVGFACFVVGMSVGFAIEWSVDWDD